MSGVQPEHGGTFVSENVDFFHAGIPQNRDFTPPRRHDHGEQPVPIRELDRRCVRAVRAQRDRSDFAGVLLGCGRSSADQHGTRDDRPDRGNGTPGRLPRHQGSNHSKRTRPRGHRKNSRSPVTCRIEGKVQRRMGTIDPTESEKGQKGYRSTSPRRQVVVPPATQTCPSSWVIRTRPRLPSTVPCAATYGAVNRPDSSSHMASDAFRLPVTGSSSVIPFLGRNARTSIAAGEPSGYGPTTPMSYRPTNPGSSESTRSASASSTATQPGPLSTH